MQRWWGDGFLGGVTSRLANGSRNLRSSGTEQNQCASTFLLAYRFPMVRCPYPTFAKQDTSTGDGQMGLKSGYWVDLKEDSWMSLKEGS